MSGKRKIGEFSPIGFLLAIVIFLLIGSTLYRRFDFHVEPKLSDRLTKEQQGIDELNRRLTEIEQRNAALESKVDRVAKNAATKKK